MEVVKMPTLELKLDIPSEIVPLEERGRNPFEQRGRKGTQPF